MAEEREGHAQIVAARLLVRPRPEDLDDGFPRVGAIQMVCEICQERARLLRAESRYSLFAPYGAQLTEKFDPPLGSQSHLQMFARYGLLTPKCHHSSSKCKALKSKGVDSVLESTPYTLPPTPCPLHPAPYTLVRICELPLAIADVFD